MNVNQTIGSDRTAFELPAELSSPRSKLVYLYLQTSRGGTIDDLQRALGLKKISLYPILDTLGKKGLVRRDGETYRPRSA